MLATLNSREIVDEIVKDTIKDNDPHDAVQISPDMVLASRASSTGPTLAPEFTARHEPKIDMKIDPKFASEPRINLEPKMPPAPEPQAAAPSVDTAVRMTAYDGHGRARRSAGGKWLRGALLTVLFAGGSAAAAIAWERHGDTAKQLLAEWTPSLASLLPSRSPTATVAAADAAPPAAQDRPADQSAPTAESVAAAPAAAATQPDTAPSVEAMTRDIAAMAQQIEQLKANISELKAGQEQMAHEMAKAAPKPVAEARPPANPAARVPAIPPRAATPPVRKPKPVVSHTYMPSYAPPPVAPSAPPPSQAIATPPPITTQAVADDDGPVVRPPMPVH